MNSCLVAPIQATARTRLANNGARKVKLSHLSDHPTIRRMFFVVPNAPSAADRL